MIHETDVVSITVGRSGRQGEGGLMVAHFSSPAGAGIISAGKAGPWLGC